jgi:hypothetical protein
VGAVYLFEELLSMIHALYYYHSVAPDMLHAFKADGAGQSRCHAAALGIQRSGSHVLRMLVIASVCLLVGEALMIGGTVLAVVNYALGILLVVVGGWSLQHAYNEYRIKNQPPSKWESVQCQDTSYVLLSADDESIGPYCSAIMLFRFLT